MNQDGKALNASRKFRGASIHDPLSGVSREAMSKPRTIPCLRKSAIVVVVIYLLAGGYLTAFANADDSLDFEITGYLRHTEYGIDGKERKKEKHFFKLWMKDDFWLIRMMPSQESIETSLASSVELGTDGEKTYRLLAYN
jgi:hypothetical protein